MNPNDTAEQNTAVPPTTTPNNTSTLRLVFDIGESAREFLASTFLSFNSMSALTEKLSEVIELLKSQQSAPLLAELAVVKQQLAAALADDASSAATIQVAVAEAAAAKALADQAAAKIVELQGLVDADAIEDQEILSILAKAVEPPQVVPTEPESPQAATEPVEEAL